VYFPDALVRLKELWVAGELDELMHLWYDVVDEAARMIGILPRGRFSKIRKRLFGFRKYYLEGCFARNMSGEVARARGGAQPGAGAPSGAARE
jgi:hypothetical protein